MTAQKGSAFLLKIGDGSATLTYETVAGLRTTQLSINGDTVVVTHKESGGWRELLSGAGTRSVSVSAAGIFLGSNAEDAIRSHALAGTIEQYELSFEDGQRCRASFLSSGLIMLVISMVSAIIRSSLKAPAWSHLYEQARQ
jgi:TP901-1 family phage major tail protein